MKKEQKLKLKQIIVSSVLLAFFVLIYNLIITLQSGGYFNFMTLLITFILDGFVFGFVTFSLASIFGKLKLGNNLQTWFAIIFGTTVYLVTYYVLQASVVFFNIVSLGFFRIAMISLALFITGKIIKK